jgi:SAM-dependent methyltransferase
MPEYVVDFSQSGQPPEPDGRLDSKAFHRNYEAIWSALAKLLEGRSGDVLEIGAGTGQHAAEFSIRAPAIAWWPTDFSESHLRSIAAWRAFSNGVNLRAPVQLDASAPDWALHKLGLPLEYVAIFCANVLHISQWSVAQGLIAGAARHLSADGRLFVYGPFRRDGVHNAESNAAFDEMLRAENAGWGVRDTADLRALAEQHKLRLSQIIEMPANNAILVFDRLA